MRLCYGLLLVFAVACGSGSSYSTSPPPPPPPAGPPPPPSPGGVSLSIQNYAFAPNSITVRAGTSVRWTNTDSVTHSVTSDSGLFTSNLSGTGTDPYGQPMGGGQYTRTFFTVGTFPYHCSVHPTMKATVIVTQ